MSLAKLQIYQDKIYEKYDRNKLDPLFKEFDMWIPTHFPSNWRTQIHIGPPPLGATAIECYELEKLLPLRGKFQKEIEDQADSIDGFYVSFATCMPAILDPVVNEAVHKIVGEVALASFYFKHLFSRQRPDGVCNLPPIFASTDKRYPIHPSYPSSHATQASAIAETLKFLVDPVGYDKFLQLRLKIDAKAFHIGYSREVAGLHFRSDTIAGIELGRQCFDMLRGSTLIAPLLVAAKERVNLLYL